MRRPAGTFDARRYFRSTTTLAFYNVGTRQVRRLSRELYLEHKGLWSIGDAMAFADALIADRHLEAKGLAIEVVARHRTAFTPTLLAAWKRWLVRGYSSNWATTDAICGSLIGPLVVGHPALASTVAGWARHPNQWVRRAAAVGLIPLLRHEERLDLAYAVARALRRDREDLIQKATGWMLREAGKADRPRLERFLREAGPLTPRTTLRYAIERFPEAQRRALLAATRSG
jgi:3-methyladenine DNA glycosylase AlkD